MYASELQKIRTAELIREAENHRLVRQLRRTRKQERRAAKNAARRQVGPPRENFGRAA